MPPTETHNLLFFFLLGHHLYSIVGAESRLRFIPPAYFHKDCGRKWGISETLQPDYSSKLKTCI